MHPRVGLGPALHHSWFHTIGPVTHTMRRDRSQRHSPHHEHLGPEPPLVHPYLDLTHQEHPRQRGKLLAAHPRRPVPAPLPFHQVVLMAQTRAAAEVATAATVLPHHHVDVHPRQRHHLI